MRARAPGRGAEVRIDGGTLYLSGVLDFDSVTTIETAGLDWLEGDAPGEAILDLGNLAFSNSAGVALILAWLRTAKEKGKKLMLRHIPGELYSMIELSGLEEFLDIEPQDLTTEELSGNNNPSSKS